MFILICIMLCQCNRGIGVKNVPQVKVLDAATSAVIIDSTSKLLTSLNISESIRDFVELVLTPVRAPSRYLFKKMKKVKNVPRKLFNAINDKDITKVMSLLNDDMNLNEKIELEDRTYTYFIHMITKQLGEKAINKIIEKGANIDEKDSEGKTPLIIAVEKGDKKAVEILINKGAKSNNKRKDGMFPIHIAVIEGHSNLIEVLIDGGERYRAISKEGLMPIHYACLMGNIEAVEAIIKKATEKEHINDGDEKGRTAIHYAAASGQPKMIEFVKNNGGKYKSDNYGVTPLHYAVINKIISEKKEVRKEIKELLVEVPRKNASVISEIIRLYKAEQKDYGDNYSTSEVTEDSSAKSSMESLQSSSKSEKNLSETKDIQILEMILHKDKSGFTPFHYGGMLGDKEGIKNLHDSLKSYIKKNKDEDNFIHNFELRLKKSWRSKEVKNKETSKATPLDLACYYNNIEVIAGLLDTEKLFNFTFMFGKNDNNSPLYYAAIKGNIAAIAKMLSLLSEQDREDWEKYTNENKQTYKEILERKEAKRDEKIWNEQYFLHNAVEENNYELIEKILSRNVDIYLQTNSGVTAMHIAAELGHHNILELIYNYQKEKGKKILALQDSNGNNKAHYAAISSSYESMKLILQYLPEAINIKNTNGDTPLHIAVTKGNKDQMVLLVNGNANVNAVNNKMYTPLILATKTVDEEKRDDIVTILLSSDNIDLDAQDANQKTAIEYLYDIDDYKNVGLLLSEEASLNVKGRNKLTLPMKVINDDDNNKSSASLILKDKKLNIEKRFPDGDTLLHRVVKNKNEIFVKYLLERGDISKIIGKSEKKYFGKKIFGKKISKPFKGKSAFSLAMKEDENSNIVGLFLQYGIDVSKRKGIYRRTPLHKSMKENKIGITEAILQNVEGRKMLNKKDLFFRKPLKISKLTSEQLIQLAMTLSEFTLLKKAVDLDKQSIFRNNLLPEGLESENEEIIEFLLKEYSERDEAREFKIEMDSEELIINIEEELEGSSSIKTTNIDFFREYFKLGDEIYLKGEDKNNDLEWKKGSITIKLENNGKVIKISANELNSEVLKFYFKGNLLFKIKFSKKENMLTEV